MRPKGSLIYITIWRLGQYVKGRVKEVKRVGEVEGGEGGERVKEAKE